MTYKFHLERDELQERLGGGLPEGALCVIEGEFGAGKSILTERLLFGLLKNHQKATMVSTELTTLHFIEQMYSLDYPVEEFILDERLLFLPVYPILGYRGEKLELVDRLLHARRMYEQDVVFIDAYSTLLKHWMQAMEQRGTPPGGASISDGVEETIFHFKLLTTRGRTIVLCVDPSDLPASVLTILKASADVYLNCRFDMSGGTVSRSVLVRRFERAEKNVADIIPFRVEPKTGFIVEIKSVS